MLCKYLTSQCLDPLILVLSRRLRMRKRHLLERALNSPVVAVQLVVVQLVVVLNMVSQSTDRPSAGQGTPSVEVKLEDMHPMK